MPANKARRKLTVGDLFSGIGGFSLGLTRAGMRIVWQSEIDPYCCAVLKKHWPDVPNLGDIYEIKNPPAVDIITGGVPCQPASCAGKRKGTADDRWLWPETLRIIHEVKPTWCILENVCGILSLEGGVVFEDLLLALEAEGYEVQPLIIPACAVGAPHRRDRVWIVGYSDESRKSQRRINNGEVCRLPEEKRKSEYRSPVSCRTDRHAPDTDRLNGDNAGHGSGEVSQFKEAKVQRCPTPNSSFGGIDGNREAWGWRREFANPDWSVPWPEVATRLCRVDDGLPAWVHRHRVARLKALGNAIVPQIAEEIGRMIMQVQKEESSHGS
jgi:DNA (cytosine-5)-methyltransferase 1